MRHRHRSAPRGSWKRPVPDVFSPAGRPTADVEHPEMSRNAANLLTLTVSELRAYAKANGVKLRDARTKARIVRVIEEAIQYGV